jgi:hypothetical protein
MTHSVSSISLGYLPVPRGQSVRRFLASALRRTSVLLARLSRRLEAAERHRAVPSSPGVIEFHAEPGTTRGALYVDGKLVAYLPGVKRL